MKKMVSLLLSAIMVFGFSTVGYTASTCMEIPSFYGRKFEISNGRVEPYEQSQVARGENLTLAIEGNGANLSLDLGNKQLQFKLLLLPSQFATYAGNTIVGVCEESTEGYNIASFRIEKNALEIGLMKDSLDLADKTVLYLAIEDILKGEISYFQMALSLNFTSVYDVVNSQYNNVEYSAAEIEQLEVSYLTFSNRESDENNSVFTTTINEDFDISDEVKNDETADGLADAINNIKDASQYGFVQLSNPRSRALITGIPDDIYKSGTFDVWKKKWNGWDERSGYAVYPLQYAGTPNRLHYVMTYSTPLKADFDDQEFDIGFKITENCWVLYYVADDEVGIFNSKARIVVDAKITCTSNTERGVFTRRYYTIVKADTLIDRASKIIVGYIPYLGDAVTIYETLTSNKDLTAGQIYPYGDNFENQDKAGKIIQEVSVCAEDLKQIDDYLYLELEGDSIDSVGFSFSYSISNNPVELEVQYGTTME